MVDPESKFQTCGLIFEAKMCSGWESRKTLVETQMKSYWHKRSGPKHEHQVSVRMEFCQDCRLTFNAARVNVPSTTTNNSQRRDPGRQHERQAAMHFRFNCVVTVSYSPSHAPEDHLWWLSYPEAVPSSRQQQLAFAQ